MKKFLKVFLVVLLLFAITIPVFAGKRVTPQKTPFYWVNGSSNNVSSDLAGGEVTIIDPMGQTSLIIQGKVRGLLPETSYDAWVRDLTGYTGDYIFEAATSTYTYYKLVRFTTDEFGNASFHIKLNADELPDGTYNIQIAINLYNNHSTTVIATQWPGLSVSVKTE